MPHRWSLHAHIRKQQIEAGRDITFNKVFIPYYEAKLKRIQPESILDIGCGTGHLALSLSKKVKRIDAIDPSLGMFKIARKVLKDSHVNVSNVSIENFKPNYSYDLIIAHLSVQTIANLSYFFTKVSKLLHDCSIVLFSIPHPCFWNNYKKWMSSCEYDYMVEKHLEVDLAITDSSEKPMKNIPYIHRPLNAYFKAIHKSNLVVVDIDEIFPEISVQMLYGSKWEEPRYMVFHLIAKS